VKTAGDLVRVLVELAARMQHRERQLDARHLLGGMDVHGDAAAIVRHRDGVVRVNGDIDRVAVAGQRFVDRVVDDLENQVVQTALGRRADVHARTLPDGFEPLQNLDLPCVVLRRHFFSRIDRGRH
jgi:hypothetical protein